MHAWEGFGCCLLRLSAATDGGDQGSSYGDAER
jgi:hypothetical protein